MADLRDKYKQKEFTYYNRFNDIMKKYNEKFAKTGNKEIKQASVSLNSEFLQEHNKFQNNEYSTEEQMKDHFEYLDVIFNKYEKMFTNKYNNGIDVFSSTKENTQNIYNYTISKLEKFKSDLKDYNSNFKRHGYSANNPRALNMINEIGDKIRALQSKYSFVINKPNADYAGFIKELLYAVENYEKLSKAIMSDNKTSLSFSERPFTEIHGSQPGE